MSKIRVKFCGLKTVADVDVAAHAGAAYAGFVFFKKSPRNVTIEQARNLAIQAPIGLAKVALVVNPTDDALDAILRDTPIDIIQLHGGETPERVTEVRKRTGLPVMKAIGIANSDDVAQAKTYARVADQLLLDAKAPKDADLPGGNGHAFDWSLIRDVDWGVPWMLAGGLTPDNALAAVQASGTRQLDVSSGIESSAGVKDHALMQAFMDAVN